VLHGTLDQHAAMLASLNDKGAGIFVMVNEGDLQGRGSVNVKDSTALFVDLDGAPLEPILQCALSPHIVVDSSKGRYHVYWLVIGTVLARVQGPAAGGCEKVCRRSICRGFAARDASAPASTIEKASRS